MTRQLLRPALDDCGDTLPRKARCACDRMQILQTCRYYTAGARNARWAVVESPAWLRLFQDGRPERISLPTSAFSSRARRASPSLSGLTVGGMWWGHPLVRR